MAVVAKSRSPSSDAIMPADKMKPLLALSKREPVQAAFGLTGEGEAVILLDKKMKPKGVRAALKSAAAKQKIQLQPSTIRFGRAEVDTEIDSTLVRFFINKDTPSSMRPKMIEVVRRATYQKVEFNVDPTLDEAPEDETEGQEEITDTAPVVEQAPAATANEPAPTVAQLDADPLRRELMVLVGRIPAAAGNDAARRASLAKLANDANTSLKAQDLPATASAVEALRAALDGTSTSPTQPAADAGNLDRLHKELAALAGWIVPAAAGDVTRRAALLALANDANTALKARDAAAATTAIGDLRAALAPAASAATGREETTDQEDLTEAWHAARANWDRANAAASAQMSALATALRASADEDLRKIGDVDLAGIVAAFASQAGTAFRGLGDNDGPAFRKAARKTLGFVEQLRGEIEDDPRIEQCDANPVGVQVSIAATMGRALDQIAAVLARAA